MYTNIHVHCASNMCIHAHACTCIINFVVTCRLFVSHPSGGGGMGKPPSTDAGSASMTSSADWQLQLLRSQIRLGEAFSGVKFNNISWEITHKGTCMYTIKPFVCVQGIVDQTKL